MSDLLAYFDRLVVPYSPPLMVVYEGDNDLAGGKSVAQVFDDYRRFTARVEQRLPGTEIAFLAVKPSPSRLVHLPKMNEFNALLREFCAGRPHLRFVDVATPMLNDQGAPRPELFQSDQLHMVAAGYEVWASVIEPVLAEAPFLAARHVLIDFGAAGSLTGTGPLPADPVNAWNNLDAEVGTSETGQLAELRSIDGALAGMSLSVERPFAGANESGAGAGGLFPVSAAGDSLFGHAEEFGGRSGVFPAFRLNGLNRSATYHFTFYASRDGVADNRETVYTITGEDQQVVGLDAANNVDRVAVAGGVVPDADGGVRIELAPGPANTSPQKFAYLGALRIEERPPPAPVTLRDEPADVTVESGQPATFRVSADGSPPFQIQWFRNGELIPGATGWMFEVPSVTPEMSGSRFGARVANSVSETTSREAVLTVSADTTPPTVVRATSADGVVVEILFSEPLDPASVSPWSRFSVHDGLVPVADARLTQDGLTLMLTLAHRVGGTVPIRLVEIADVAGNQIIPNTSITLEAPSARPRTFLFDFGSSGSSTNRGTAPVHDPVNAWNNVGTIGLNPSGRLDGLISADGQATTVSLRMVSRFNGANENGTSAAPGLPSNASRDSLFGNTETFNGLSNIFPSFKIVGLPSGVPLDFTFYASRTGVSDNRETGYQVTGANSGFAALNVANNVSAMAEVRGILPAEGGEITVSIAPTASNTNANHFTYLGVLRVQSAQPLSWSTVHRLTPNTLVIDWSGDGLLEWSDEPGADTWNPIVPPPSPPWFENLSEHPRRFFRLRSP